MIAAIALWSMVAAPAQTEAGLAGEARKALVEATRYLVSISTGGGYLWEYSLDLKQRWGEGKATQTQIWVQPPGTPSVGAALLEAWQATGDKYILLAAKAAGDALVWGQLECGGWAYSIDFSPRGQAKYYYRHMKRRKNVDVGRLRNYGTLDDNTSQAATSFLIALAKATGEEKYLEAARYALDWFLRAQFANGAWPQVFPPVGARDRYWNLATFNDGAINDAVRVMLEAWRAFGDDRYLQAARKAGDFVILSQGKPPQAAWAQQYDAQLKPAWARKFEPPSWCSAVTARNIRTLVDIYLATGEEKYLAPIPAAIKWLEASRLPDGRWARFYELRTNKPLYFTRDYKLTYSPDDCPTHYSFRGHYGVESAIRYYRSVVEAGRQAYLANIDKERTDPTACRQRAGRLATRVKDIIAAQDEQGRWVRGERVRMSDFVRNIRTLAQYLSLLRVAEK